MTNAYLLLALVELPSANSTVKLEISRTYYELEDFCSRKSVRVNDSQVFTVTQAELDAAQVSSESYSKYVV